MRNAFLRGMLFSAIGRYSSVLAMIAVNAVLSRLLTPKDFGQVALVTVAAVLLDQVAQAGLQPAVIQDQSLTKGQLRVIFNYSLIFSFSGCLLLGALGVIIGTVSGNTTYSGIAWALAPGVLFKGAAAVPTGLLLKEHRFASVNVSLLVSSIVGGGLSIWAAVSGWGVFALPVQTGITSLVSLVVLLSITRIWVTRSLDKSVISRVIGFASRQFAFNLVNYVSRNLDTLLVGRFLGTTALGNYNKAYTLVTYPNGAFLGLITPVLQPVLARHQDNVQVIRHAYLKLVHVLSTVGLAVSVFMAVGAEPLVLTLFGSQWEEAILPCRILSATVWVQMTMSSTGAVFQARNKPRLLLITGIIGAIILGCAIIIGVLVGSIVSVSLTLAVGFYINWAVCFWLLMTRALDGKLLDVVRLLFRPMVIALITGLPLLLVEQMISIESVVARLGILISVWAVLTLLAAILLGEAKTIWNMVSGRSNHDQ